MKVLYNICAAVGFCMIVVWTWLLIQTVIQRFSAKRNPWTYGYCNSRVARKHKISGEVQFILWEAGEMGYIDNFWFPMDPDWWDSFKEDASVKNRIPSA